MPKPIDLGFAIRPVGESASQGETRGSQTALKNGFSAESAAKQKNKCREMGRRNYNKDQGQLGDLREWSMTRSAYRGALTLALVMGVLLPTLGFSKDSASSHLKAKSCTAEECSQTKKPAVSEARLKRSARLWGSLKVRRKPALYISRQVHYPKAVRVINPFHPQRSKPPADSGEVPEASP